MSTINSEIYSALIDEVKADLKVIKWGIALIVTAEVLSLMKDIFS
ncbi:MAG: hypothetical protein methR_P2491 [Methyloprofundus sp.]|nr:MAG: hypothetical protein methR_P2491 [Methyloprofundus sp.]